MLIFYYFRSLFFFACFLAGDAFFIDTIFFLAFSLVIVFSLFFLFSKEVWQ